MYIIYMYNIYMYIILYLQFAKCANVCAHASAQRVRLCCSSEGQVESGRRGGGEMERRRGRGGEGKRRRRRRRIYSYSVIL
jgi:hypothetical protein